MLLLLIAIFLAPAALHANTILGGIEDLPGGGREGYGDFNDMTFRMDGSIQIAAPGASFNNLLATIPSGNGNTFWDHSSMDGGNVNVGFCMLGTGSCNITNRPPGPLQYLAVDGSQAPLEVVFESKGPVTFTMTGEMAGQARWNTLGWYDPENPNELHWIFLGSDSTGATATFHPGGRFVLFSTNGLGQSYSSISTANVGESGAFQHFAFFQTSAPIVSNPEPGTFVLGGLGIAILWVRRRRG
jgi:hypothetical protein